MIDIKNIKITNLMLSYISEIDSFKTFFLINKNYNLKNLEGLKKISTIESIASSNRIEGNKLSDKEVEEFLKIINWTSFKSRDEEEVAGYSKLMSLIFDDFNIIPLSSNYIKQLHGILLQYTSKDSYHRGEYKKVSNNVSAFDKYGHNLGVVFETATPFDTPRLIEELISDTKINLEDSYIHPLIVIGCFIVHFLAIHPFQDGNGRLSRALTIMLLLQKGYSYVPYSSIESIIEKSKDNYYRALRETQKTIFKDNIDYEPWLTFFLKVLLKQKRILEEKIKVQNTHLNLSENKILELFNKKGELTSNEISEFLNLNIETVKKNLQNLQSKGYILKQGITKGVFYKKIT